MKRVILFVMVIVMVIITGCFDVERNNPFDPESGELYNNLNKEIILKGKTFRGYSNKEIANVQVDIYQGLTLIDSTQTDVNGAYTFRLQPGKYKIEAIKQGWSKTEVIVNYSDVRKNETVVIEKTQRINMFVWYENFDSYQNNSIPNGNPWYSAVSGSGNPDVRYLINPYDTNLDDIVIKSAVVSGDSGSQADFYVMNLPPTPSGVWSTINTIEVDLVWAFWDLDPKVGFTLFDEGARPFFDFYLYYDTGYFRLVMEIDGVQKISNGVQKAELQDKDFSIKFVINQTRTSATLYRYIGPNKDQYDIPVEDIPIAPAIQNIQSIYFYNISDSTTYSSTIIIKKIAMY